LFKSFESYQISIRCSECNKVFNCPANLASHKRWHRPNTNKCEPKPVNTNEIKHEKCENQTIKNQEHNIIEPNDSLFRRYELTRNPCSSFGFADNFLSHFLLKPFNEYMLYSSRLMNTEEPNVSKSNFNNEINRDNELCGVQSNFIESPSNSNDYLTQMYSNYLASVFTIKHPTNSQINNTNLSSLSTNDGDQFAAKQLNESAFFNQSNRFQFYK
jgi:hypothetical protein